MTPSEATPQVALRMSRRLIYRSDLIAKALARVEDKHVSRSEVIRRALEIALPELEDKALAALTSALNGEDVDESQQALALVLNQVEAAQ